MATGKREFFYGQKSTSGRFVDHFFASSLTNGRLQRTWRYAKPGHRLNLIHASLGEVRLRDLTAAKVLTLDTKATVVRNGDLGKPGGFTTMPIAVDLDGDGRNEVVVQNAASEIVALRALSPGNWKTLWSRHGMAMNMSPGYAWNGALCPQAADMDGDGRPEVLFTAEDQRGMSSLVCVSGAGKAKWSRSVEGCPWGGLQSGVDHWTFGRFTGRQRGLDVYVDLHRRSKGSGEGRVLRGDTGQRVWQREGLVAPETAMPFGGGIPAVADMNADGVDDLMQSFYTVYGCISGDSGNSIFPPAFLPSPQRFGKWLAYSEPTVADLNGDGTLDVYLNSRSYARGGYAAVSRRRQATLGGVPRQSTGF